MNPSLYTPLAPSHVTRTVFDPTVVVSEVAWSIRTAISVPPVSPLLAQIGNVDKEVSIPAPGSVAAELTALAKNLLLPLAMEGLRDVIATGCYPADLSLRDLRTITLAGGKLAAVVKFAPLPDVEAPTLELTISCDAPAEAVAIPQQVFDAVVANVRTETNLR